MKKQNCRARNTHWQTLLDKNRKFSGKLIQTLKFITSWFMCIYKLFEKNHFKPGKEGFKRTSILFSFGTVET